MTILGFRVVFHKAPRLFRSSASMFGIARRRWLWRIPGRSILTSAILVTNVMMLIRTDGPNMVGAGLFTILVWSPLVARYFIYEERVETLEAVAISYLSIPERQPSGSV
jgi:hypothetical protein